MPDQNKHLAQASSNEALYQYLGSATPPFRDWQITALFYAALHYVDAYLAKTNIHPSSHEQRDRWIAMLSDLQAIYSRYQDLQNYSRNARYDLAPFRAGFEQVLHDSYFVPIRDYLLRLI